MKVLHLLFLKDISDVMNMLSVIIPFIHFLLIRVGGWSLSRQTQTPFTPPTSCSSSGGDIELFTVVI